MRTLDAKTASAKERDRTSEVYAVPAGCKSDFSPKEEFEAVCYSFPRVKVGSKALHAVRAVRRGAGIALFLAGCRDAQPRAAERPIEVLVSSDAETLDPRYSVDAVALRVTRLVHAGLVRLDPVSLEPLPYLAKSWRWVDPLSLWIELRDDVRFHTGAPFTSRDVTSTLRAFASPEVGSRHARIVEPILSVEEDGAHAVVIRMRRPHATLLTDLELPILRADQAAGPKEPGGALDGLGPFTVRRFARGEIVLSAAPGAAFPTPAHDISIRTVRDENARALRLHAGRADVALNVLSPTLLPAMEGREGLSVVSRPGANLTYMLVRADRGPMADLRVRRALSLAIDREGLARTLLGGYAQPATTLLPPAHWAYTPLPSLPLDKGLARRLLEEAGNSHLKLSLLTSTDRLRGSIARTVAQGLSDIGVELEITPLELGTMIARLNAGDFDLAMLQLPELAEPNVLRVFLHSAYIPPNGSNRGRVRDDEVDRLLDLGDSTTAPGARREVYARLEERIRDQGLLLPLWHEDQVAVTSARARAFVPSAEGRWLGLAQLP